MVSDRAFFSVSALLFAASAAGTIVWCASMSAMGEMPMPGGWTMSMAWMRMPGQTCAGAAVLFLGMWVVMMVAMMLPSLVHAAAVAMADNLVSDDARTILPPRTPSSLRPRARWRPAIQWARSDARRDQSRRHSPRLRSRQRDLSQIPGIQRDADELLAAVENPAQFRHGHPQGIALRAVDTRRNAPHEIQPLVHAIFRKASGLVPRSIFLASHWS
jgi:hypothetical protein